MTLHFRALLLAASLLTPLPSEALDAAQAASVQLPVEVEAWPLRLRQAALSDAEEGRPAAELAPGELRGSIDSDDPYALDGS